MNLFARTLSPTSSVGTMLSEGMRNASRTKGRTKPKTSTKAIRMVRQSSVKPALLFFLCRSQRTSRRRFGAPSFQKRSSLTLEHPDARRWPEAYERLALYVLDGQRPKHPGVRRVRPVVPHYEDLPLRQPRRAKEAVVRDLAVEVGFILRLFVYAQHAPTNHDLVPRYPHYALYQVLFPAVHALEDHHVSSLGLGEAVDELVHEDPVAHLQGGHHALRGDAKRLEYKRAHEAKNQHEGDQDGKAELGKAGPSLFPLPLPAHLAPALRGPVLPEALFAHLRAPRCATAARSVRTPRPLCSRWATARRRASRPSSPGCPPLQRPPPQTTSSGQRSCRPGSRG